MGVTRGGLVIEVVAVSGIAVPTDASRLLMQLEPVCLGHGSMQDLSPTLNWQRLDKHRSFPLNPNLENNIAKHLSCIATVLQNTRPNVPALRSGIWLYAIMAVSLGARRRGQLTRTFQPLCLLFLHAFGGEIIYTCSYESYSQEWKCPDFNLEFASFFSLK
jgi:hypothetical protein